MAVRMKGLPLAVRLSTAVAVGAFVELYPYGNCPLRASRPLSPGQPFHMLVLLLLLTSVVSVTGYWLQRRGDSSGTCFSYNSGPNRLDTLITSPTVPGEPEPSFLVAPLVAPGGSDRVYVAMADPSGGPLMVKLFNGADLSLMAQIAVNAVNGTPNTDMSSMAVQSDGTLWVPSVGVVASDLSSVLVPYTATPPLIFVAASGQRTFWCRRHLNLSHSLLSLGSRLVTLYAPQFKFPFPTILKLLTP